MTIKVLIADDHLVIREGLSAMMMGTEVSIVAEASSGSQVLTIVKKHQPDVVLLDVRLAELDGLDLLARLRKDFPQIPVVMLSAYDNSTYVARAAALGAADYLLKGSSRRDIIAAIKAAAAGKESARDGAMGRVSNAMTLRKEPGQEDIPLSQREMQVLRHIALGLSNKDIASSLTLSTETVKEHVQNILRKLGVANRTQAAIRATGRGLA